MEKKKRDNGNKGLKKSDGTKEKMSKAKIGNLNAEKYSEVEATKLFTEALELSMNRENDFIGEIAQAQGVYIMLYNHLFKRFPTLKDTYDVIMSNLQTNCYYNTKKGRINTAVGIINLKSNHKWSDRIETNNTTDITSGGQPITLENLISFAKDENDGENKP